MTERPSLTRRGLLRGFGTASVLAGCNRPGSSEAPEGELSPPAGLPAAATAIGPGPAPLAFRLNGVDKALEVPPSATLLAVLRHELGATGTKEVCDRGACGACSVLVDGAVRTACMTLAHDVAGREVTTVEGLAEGGQPSALQRAFVAEDALQCGYCTPGMLIACTALMRRSPGPLAPDEIQRAIAGNLCRCGSYPHIIAAVTSVAGQKGS